MCRLRDTALAKVLAGLLRARRGPSGGESRRSSLAPPRCEFIYPWFGYRRRAVHCRVARAAGLLAQGRQGRAVSARRLLTRLRPKTWFRKRKLPRSEPHKARVADFAFVRMLRGFSCIVFVAETIARLIVA